MNYVKEHDAILQQAAAQVKAPTFSELNDKILALQNGLKEAQRQVNSLEKRLANQAAENAFSAVKSVGKWTMITTEMEVESMDVLRETADSWKQNTPSDVLILAANLGDKVNLLVAVAPDAVKQGVKAGDLIKAIAPSIGGGGGGRPDMAQAGGKNPAGISDAFTEAENWLTNK